MSEISNRRRQSDKEKRGRYQDAPVDFKKLLRDRNINPALPWAILNAEGTLVFASPRMLSLLALDRRGAMEFPLEKSQWESQFHFFTEEDSKSAIVEKIYSRIAEKKSLVVVTENRMKTFRVLLKPFLDLGADFKKNEWLLNLCGAIKKNKTQAWGLLVIEVLRAGDLLQDSQNRQALFRSFSHELRTSVTNLNGMIAIALESPNPTEQLARMKESVKRMERIVDRLGEFRSLLGLENDVISKNQKRLKQK
jgi:hypothetical protein